MEPEVTPGLTIYFMVEPGPLELQAWLLVASLRVNCGDPLRLVGFCRADRVEGLQPDTLDWLEAQDVLLVPMENDFPDGYPAGNKLIAGDMLPPAEWVMFMDTDMALVRPARFLEVAAPGCVNLCLDTVNGWSDDPAQWAALYGAAGLALPEARVELESGQVSIPIYNAGLVLYPAAEAAHFGRQWIETARIVDAAPEVGRKRPWLDTIALPVALARAGAPGVNVLPMDWNCTTRLAGEATRVLHYHGYRQLFGAGWAERLGEILVAAGSPHRTLDALGRHYRDVLKAPGDVYRRAMRHGTMG